MTQNFALALHTTTTVLELAIAEINPNFDQDLDQPSGRNAPNYIIHKQQSWDLGRELSVQLHDCLNAFMGDLPWSELAFVAIATGIGSFTGTRIGVVAARTIAEQLDIPLYGIACDAIDQIAQGVEPNLSLSEAMLAIAADQWRSQQQLPPERRSFPHWSEVLPKYE